MGGVKDEVLERRSPSPYIPPDAVMSDVIFKESGFGFLIGNVAGFAYHPIFCNKSGCGFSPSLIPRLRYSLTKAPLTGSKFAYWFGLRAFVEHTTAAIRNKADPLNSFVSGAVVAGLAARHRGPIAASAASLLLGSCFALFDAGCDRYYYQKADSRSDCIG